MSPLASSENEKVELTKEEVKEEKKEEKEEEKEEEVEVKKDEEEIEIKEDEDKEVDDDEVEIVTPVSKKEILRKYPNIFKEFPALEANYYKAQQYTEILPTVKDAQVALDKANTLDNLEAKLSEGSIYEVLVAAKNAEPRAFNKIVDNYMEALQRVDQGAHLHIVGNLTKSIVVGMVREAKASNNEKLQDAASLVYQYVFGSSEYTPPTKLDKGENEEESRLKREREEFTRQRFETSRDDLNGRIRNVLKSTINDYIDPRKSMTDYVKKTAVNDVLDGLDESLESDKAFSSILDKLWRKAFEDNFSPNSLKTIRSAYLSKAKTYLPTIIKKVRSEALRDSNKTRTKDDGEEKDRKGPLPTGSTSRTSSGKITSAKDIPKGMKTLDILNMD